MMLQFRRSTEAEAIRVLGDLRMSIPSSTVSSEMKGFTSGNTATNGQNDQTLINLHNNLNNRTTEGSGVSGKKLKKAISNQTPAPPRGLLHKPSSSIETLTLMDLPSSEKEKVARLVDRLLSLGQEFEQLQEQKLQEKIEFERKEKIWSEKILSLNKSIEEKEEGHSKQIQSLLEREKKLLLFMDKYQQRLESQHNELSKLQLAGSTHKDTLTKLEFEKYRLDTQAQQQLQTIEKVETAYKELQSENKQLREEQDSLRKQYHNESVSQKQIIDNLDEKIKRAYESHENDITNLNSELEMKTRYLGDAQLEIQKLREEVSESRKNFDELKLKYTFLTNPSPVDALFDTSARSSSSKPITMKSKSLKKSSKSTVLSKTKNSSLNDSKHSDTSMLSIPTNNQTTSQRTSKSSPRRNVVNIPVTFRLVDPQYNDQLFDLIESIDLDR